MADEMPLACGLTYTLFGTMLIIGGVHLLSKDSFVGSLATAAGAYLLYIPQADLARGSSIEKYMPHELAKRGLQRVFGKIYKPLRE